MSHFDITTEQHECFRCCEFVMWQVLVISSSLNLFFHNSFLKFCSLWRFEGEIYIERTQDVRDEIQMKSEN